MSGGSLLPKGLGSALDSVTESEADIITDLQGQLTNANDALLAESAKVTSLTATNKVLRDNSKIKTDAVRYAKISLIAIPLACLLLLLLSALGDRKLNICGVELDLSLELNSYAQAALIVAPIAFFATIIGFLLKGVFGQNVDVKNLSATEVMKGLKNNK